MNRKTERTIPLLMAKLYVPKLHRELISRSRLLETLDAGLKRGHKLTFVSAPAGFGKTTLVADWVRHSEHPVAWVSLDEGDSDPSRFWAYIFKALRDALPALGDEAPGALRSGQAPAAELLLGELINTLVEESVEKRVLLVLDDYHTVGAAAVHEALTFLLDNLPPALHLVIVTRVDPPLPLPRLRARGLITELRASDLRLTPEEAAAFLNEVMRLELSPQEVSVLEERTEGWIAGLQLAALSMRGREDTGSFVSALAGDSRFILDYLIEEVLHQQPQDVQDFLVRTSVLKRLSAPLCARVLGDGPPQADSRALLERLERANLFLVPLDERREWYRYHHLFAEFLRSRLSGERPEVVEGLHRRAATWYEGQGLVLEAVEHALAGRDFERAARLIEEVAREVMVRGETTTLLGWMDALPGSLIPSRPQLTVVAAWVAILASDLGAAEGYVSKLEEAPLPQELEPDLATLRSVLAVYGWDMPTAAAEVRRAAQLVDEGEPFLFGIVTWLQGLIRYYTHGTASALESFTEGARVGQVAGNPLMAFVSLYSLAFQRFIAGQLVEAERLFRRGLKHTASQPGSPPVYRSLFEQGLGDLLRERGELAAAEEHLLRGIELGRRLANVEMLVDGYIALARLRLAQGDLDAALEALRGMERFVYEGRVNPLTARQIAAYRARVLIARRDLAAAERWAAGREAISAEQMGDESGAVSFYLRQLEDATLARLLIAREDFAGALSLVEGLLAARAEGREGSLSNPIELLVLRAIALHGLDRTKEAVKSMGKALAIAEVEGHARVFLDEGARVAELLAYFPASSHARRLLEALPSPHEDGAPTPVPPPQPLVEPLSERELEVLQLIAEGYTNREIAGRLYIAVSTVKSHINNIYGKLEAKGRAHAVAQARQLGLI
jgi:LuxR family maltose regulon positive regulatory protein